MKKVLQVKYCYTEDELNHFLKSLYTENAYSQRESLPKLKSIQYIPKVKAKAPVTKIESECDILAIVEYYIDNIK